MSDKLTSEQIAGFANAYPDECGALVAHIAALEAENARRDLLLFRYAFFHGSDGMGIDEEYAAQGVKEFDRLHATTHPTSQTVKDHGND